MRRVRDICCGTFGDLCAVSFGDAYLRQIIDEYFNNWHPLTWVELKEWWFEGRENNFSLQELTNAYMGPVGASVAHADMTMIGC